MKKLQESIQESFQTIQKAWSEALTSLHGVEEEVARRYRQLKEQTGFQQSSEEVQRVLADLGRRLQDSSDAMEKKLETVYSVYSRVKTPLADELANLKQKAEHLSRRIESQLRTKESPPAEAPAEPQEPRSDAPTTD
jgi:chromosome segregation ATPase